MNNTNGGAYAANALVSSNGVIYRNLTGTNTDTAPATDFANWATIVDVDSVPLWKSMTNGGSYAANDIINYGGVLYKNLTGTNLDTLPTADAVNWVQSSDATVTAWVNNTNGGAYAANALVSSNGAIYRNLTGTNTDTAPATDFVNWRIITSYLGNRTIHHDVTTDLAITQALHNNADIHVESIGDLTIENTAVSDATNFYITNTTAADRMLSFTGFMGAYLRNGGVITNLVSGGLTLKANTRYIAHITKNGANYFFNATEAASGGGSAGQTIEALTASGTPDTNSTLLLVTPASDTTISLPAVSDYSTGFELTIKRVGAATGTNDNITIDPDGTETIDGAATVNLNVGYQSIIIVNTGTEWVQIN